DLAEAQAKATRAQASRRTNEQSPPNEAEAQKERSIEKMNYTGGWMMAFQNYALQHAGQVPTTFEAAVSFLPQQMLNNQSNLAPEQFEIMYTGAFSEIANAQSVIVIREKQAWQTPDGGWAR